MNTNLIDFKELCYQTILKFEEKTKLPRCHDDGLVNDDTQLGIEFAYEQIELQLAELLAEQPTQAEPVAEVLTKPIGDNAVCAIQWLNNYQPVVGTKLFTQEPVVTGINTDESNFAFPDDVAKDGYVLVPLEPTNAMIDAAYDAVTYENDVGVNNLSYCYKAMIKAMLASNGKE